MSDTPKMNVVVIGAMKAATSSVCAYLEDCPEVYMVPGSDPNYFSDEDQFARGVGWYESLLAERTTERLCAEGSNDYAARRLFPDAAERMYAYNPDMKIIYMARHPIARIISHWLQNRSDMGHVTAPIVDEAIEQRYDFYVSKSLYWENLQMYRNWFDDRQIFVGFLEDLHADQDAFYSSLTKFLGIEPTEQVLRGHQNKSADKKVASPLLNNLLNNPAVKMLKPLVPRKMKNFIRKDVLVQKAPKAVTLGPAAHASVMETVAEDSRLFLQYCKKPEDFWRF